MSESSWNLVIPVLAIGLTVGVAWVVWLRQRRADAARATARDQALERADLEARQAILYEQLRTAEGAEREELETAAARNMMALERAGSGRTEKAAAGTSGEAPAPLATPARAASSGRPSGWMGFVGGVACASLIGVLILWAQRDAQPRPDDGMSGPVTAEEAHPEGPPISAREREALEQLADRVMEDPTDLMARKQYAVGLLSTGQFVAAFEQAEVLLTSNPNDPDGLYVLGMVRMRMGQEREAGELLERLVVDYPDHVPALTALGVLALRGGGLEAADVYWQQALEASGGRNPEIERLRVAAREQVAARGGEAGAPPTAAAAPAPARTMAPPAAAGPSYTLQLELASGVSAPPSALLFVALRGVAGGPPAAVKRITRPSFPLTVILSAADSMMGQPLPDAGLVTVRLDTDGNASTRDDSEPSAEQEMRVGETVRLTLE